jgi:D-glycerate 3-kinase
MKESLINKLNILKNSFSIKENLNKNFKNIYLKIAELIFLKKTSLRKPLIIGLAGGQGSGKTTFAQFLKLILENRYNLKTISVSIDDIYKTKKDRIKISNRINKLFLTRGVPGTHDVNFLTRFFKVLKNNKFNKSFLIPKFDKSIDDRLPKNKWHYVEKNIDIFILEGWCVGARPEENNRSLKKPINKLEALEDKNCKWRFKVNEQLKNDYKELFSFIDLMIYLKVPNFNKVLTWRGLQEKKLAYSRKNISKNKNKIMSESEIKRFIMFYERITKKMLIDMPKFADIIVPISSNHQPKKIILN